mmetsp:Transcript_9137/g.14049  ORF Transcript_9137/g.14049 Transcript_9137/m.14049 type:complete len:324 (-) Transcript_9137:144-1115(-)
MPVQSDFSELEDLIIWKAFIFASADELPKNDARAAVTAFRGRLFAFYLRLCHRVIREAEENEEYLDDSKIPYQQRTAKSIEKRFRSSIGPEFMRFQEILKTEPPRKRESDKAYYERCQRRYKRKYKGHFNYEFFHDYVRMKRSDKDKDTPPVRAIYVKKDVNIIDSVIEAGIEIIDMTLVNTAAIGARMSSGCTNAGSGTNAALMNLASKEKQKRKELKEARREKLLRFMSPSDQKRFGQMQEKVQRSPQSRHESSAASRKKLNFFQALFAATATCTGNKCYALEDDINDYYMDAVVPDGNRKMVAKQLMVKELRSDVIPAAA